MSIDADQILDRRRLRRKLTTWRVVAFVAAALAIVGGGLLAAGPDALGGRSRPHIARLTISGFISENRAELDLIDKIGKSDAVQGVIVSINSGGGATAGGEALYDAIRKLSDKKPTVAAIRTVGASAAYMTAIAADHVVAYRTSITGSIGVLFQSPEVSEAMAKLGIKLTEVKSSPLKAAPSPFAPPTPEALAVIDSMIRDTYNWFVDIVAERRNLDRPKALQLADGRVFSGHQALEAGLIDEIGGEETAIAWLTTKKGVDARLRVVDWEPESSGSPFSFSSAAFVWLARQAGFSPDLLYASGVAGLLPSRLQLDGLLSVWHAPTGLNDAEGAPR
ncbi:signal peptide peptidase SppA [Kaistia defluvii]|uniref:signal peptide peptidase SppA n=1 Tax=Kaistia defluvii TaxID=410841 RepID=UPI00225028D3|nr:signal peptide peptidase SppA [Kaistia defluvii]MCX5520589.1 signal peptide peptidase SppA [Kaistia defluvii]